MCSVNQLRAAFSLVELSIVLVILGLLTGGILSGQSLIRAAEIRTVSTDYQKYMTAIYSFRDKYFALPGDMAMATKFWPAADGSTGSTAGCMTQTSTSATCNGNGDGQITTSTASYEPWRIPQHLALSGLIEGSYPGWATTPTPGVVAPRMKVDATAVVFVEYGAIAGTTQYFSMPAGHNGSIFTLTAPYTFLTPQEAWNVDTKMDDGRPSQGKVWGYKGTTAQPCTDRANQAAGAADAAAVYNLLHTGKACYVDFPSAF